MKKLISICLFVSLSFPVCADNIKDKDKDKDKETINEKMTRIGKSMENIFPLLFSADAFSKKENDKKVTKALTTLYSEMKSAGPHFKDFPVTYGITHGAMVEHLKETLRVYQNGNKEFAQVMAKSSVNFCMGCHTQDNAKRTLFPQVTRGQFETAFQFAEFNYMTREYDKALLYYDKFLGSTNNLEGRYRERALKRKLSIFAELIKDPELAVLNLSKHLKDESFPEVLKSDIQNWIKSFKTLQKEKVFKKDEYTFEEIKKYVHQHLADAEEGALFAGTENTIRYFRLRSILSEYLFDKPKDDEIPQLLYWLSLSERALNYGLFYSIGNLYLKQCIVKYPKHPFARKCYREYREQMFFSYSGSAGRNLPKDVIEELDQLKKVIKD